MGQGSVVCTKAHEKSSENPPHGFGRMKLGPSGRAADTLSLWAFSLVSEPQLSKIF